MRVADLERRLIWPDTEYSPPDILLSIGSGCNITTRFVAVNTLHCRRRETDYVPTRSSSAAAGTHHNVFEKIRKTTEMSKVIKLLKSRVENILDTEMSWLKFMSDGARGDEEAITRYQRINPNLQEEPPKLDDVKMLPYLRSKMYRIMWQTDFQKKIGEVARLLVASSFYVDVIYIPTSPPQDSNPYVLGMIFFHSITRTS